MPKPSTFTNPLLGLLPGAISYAALVDLLACLPRPRPGCSAAYARGFIHDTMAMLDAIAPRDRLEAAWAIQGVIFLAQARAALREANAAADPARAERARRHAIALQRRMEAMQALIERHRRTLAQDDLEHLPPPGWEYDVDMVVAAWLDPEHDLPETALRVRKQGLPPIGVREEARRAALAQAGAEGRVGAERRVEAERPEAAAGTDARPLAGAGVAGGGMG